MKYHGVTKEKGRADRIKWDAPECSTKKDSGTADADIPAAQPKKAG